MTVALNHTIVWCRDRHVSADFLADMLALPPPRDFHHFRVVEVANGVSLDFAEPQAAIANEAPIASQHYAFLVDDATFDHVLARIQERGIAHWADPARKGPDEISHNDGGRGVYFIDPDGHFLEALTVPYGGVKH